MFHHLPKAPTQRCSAKFIPNEGGFVLRVYIKWKKCSCLFCSCFPQEKFKYRRNKEVVKNSLFRCLFFLQWLLFHNIDNTIWWPKTSKASLVQLNSWLLNNSGNKALKRTWHARSVVVRETAGIDGSPLDLFQEVKINLFPFLKRNFCPFLPILSSSHLKFFRYVLEIFLCEISS